MAVQVPLAGSYSSALAKAVPLLSRPPATSTLPFGSNVAVCNKRAVLRLPVAVQVPLAGSYSSALAEMLTVQSPCNQDHAVWQQRRRVIDTCGVEAACDSPGPARRSVAVRQCRNRRQSQKKRVRDCALLGGGSLTEREWDHANSHKQKQVKGASKNVSANFVVRFHSYTSVLRREPSVAIDPCGKRARCSSRETPSELDADFHFAAFPFLWLLPELGTNAFDGAAVFFL